MKRLLLILLASCGAVYAQQNALLLPWTPQQFTNTNGTVLANGKVCTYQAGTSTGLATFTDATGSVSNNVPPNAILLDSTGRPTSGGIWLSAAKAYKIIVLTAGSDSTCNTGVTIKTQDNVAASNVGANNVFTGANTFKQINNKLWASQFAGADCGAKADAAFAQTGGPWEVEIDQICAPSGVLGSTQIVVPAGNGLAFDQPGSYTTSNAQVQAIFLNAGAYLDCRSRGAVTITENQANTHVVTVLSSTEVRNCDLHGTGTAGTASAINSGSASNVYIHDNILESMGSNGINTGANPTEWRVENNLIRNNLSEGFLCAPSCTQSYIAYNHFTGNASNGFDLNGGTNRVIGNEADHNGGAGASGLDKDGMISFASGATSNSLNNIWIGNYSHDNNTHGFRWQSGSGGTTQGNIYIGNRSTGNGTGTTPCGSGFVLRNDTTNGIVSDNTFIGNSARGNLGSGAGCADGFALISSTGAGAFNTTQIIGGEMQSNANWGIEIINNNAVDTDVRDTVLIANTTGTFTDGGLRSRIRGIKNQQTDSEDPVNTGTFAIAGPTSTIKTLRIYGFNNTDDLTNFHAIFSDNGANSTIDIQPIGGKFFKFDGVSGLGRGVTWIADQGTACTNGELALSAGWQSTGSATVTAAAGTGQTCSWTITTGTTTAANPTVTDTLTNGELATVVCEMNIHGGTHTATAGEGFTQTTLSATAPIFTFTGSGGSGTPQAGGVTYLVTRRCGP